MSRRIDFLASLAATAVAGSATIAYAAGAYRVDGEYSYGQFGAVRSVTFFGSGDRPDAQIIFASIVHDNAKAEIVAGSQSEIRGLQLWHLADERNATIGVNGGFFQGNSFYYDGLLVINGRQISARDSQFSGAVTLDANGALSLQRIDDVANPVSAMQTGPFFIDPGGTMGMRSHTYDRFPRSFIAQGAGVVVTGITSPLSLYQLAEIMLQYPQPFQVVRFDAALNLCGAETSAFFARTGKTMVREGGAINSPVVLLFSPR
ncbi:MAG TPA: phosphodiester glycosidase family protein [Candidatus Rubrimentiphilum sp.]|nr:phosphodiester glycosidase family protein [Candidatus Rubrimentiphilum sp.]